MNVFEKLKNGDPVDMTSEEYRPAIAELMRFGDNVQIGPHVTIVTDNHDLKNRSVLTSGTRRGFGSN